MGIILVAEDERVSQLLLSAIVRELGYTPISAGNGRSALEFLEKNHRDVDLLITDIMMPEMDGYALIESIRSNDQISGLPIIVQSAYLGVKKTARLMEKNIDYVLPKPINQKHLMQYIKQSIANA